MSLREKAQKATKGPWHRAGRFIGFHREGRYPMSETGTICEIHGDVKETESDAEYIAAASPDVILELLDLLEEARKALQPFNDCTHSGMQYVGPLYEREIEVGNFAHVSWNDLQQAQKLCARLNEKLSQ